jgi:NAD(P)-dependent dehydrogenase (short-subunit alcohol dehydrogenase family)
MASNLTGKVAVVTGGSKGIGLGIASRLAADGAAVWIATNEASSLAEALAHIQGNVDGGVADVAVATDMMEMAAAAKAAFGGIDILVNSAGIQRYGSVVDTPEAVWDDVMNVNLKGIFLASKAAIPHIHDRGGGSIINIASVQGYASQAGVAAYTASKGGILALTRAMALDHAGDGIRVNAICPASIDTPMLHWAADLWKGDRTSGEMLALWGQAHPVGRVGRPDEIGALAAFLASDDCAFMTGADLKVDGGVLAKLGIVLPD